MEISRANDPNGFDAILAAVRERLTSRRIGFLWQGEPIALSPAPGFTWVHYANGGRGTRCYDLKGLRRPDLEARTLHMLVVPAGSLPTLAELASGLLISPEAAMIDGALRASVPVLFGAPELSAWYASADEAPRARLNAAIEGLRLRGLELLGSPPGPRASAPAANVPAPANSVAQIQEGGWLSWADIAERVRGARFVRLAPGARLTPEARDRLMNLKIRIVGEGP